jgi:elongation factor Ts
LTLKGTTMSTPITAKAVSELRQRTGAGMMDCKKALEETAGDMDAAVEYLRMKGMAKADKRADRSAKEGIVGTAVLNEGRSGVLVEVGCETDFVARNEDFGKFVDSLVAQMSQSTAADTATFLAEPMADGSGTVEEYVKATSAKTGELTVVKNVARFDAGANGQVGIYSHHNKKLATMVQITASSPEAAAHEGTRELIKFIAEHIAAMNPIAVDRTGVPQAKIESEQRIAEEQAREAGKPDAMIAKIATGKVEAFLKDVTLLPQAWVRDPKQTIADVIKDTEGRVGGKITVDRFVRLQLGAD